MASPDAMVRALHRFPRISGGNNFNATDPDYQMGSLLIACPFIIIAASVFMIWTFIRLCRFCGKCKTEGVTHYTKTARILFIVVSFLIAPACILSLVGNLHTVDGSEAVLNTSTHFADLLSKVSSTSESLLTSISSSRGSYSQFTSMCPNLVGMDVFQQIQTLGDDIDNHANTFREKCPNWSSGNIFMASREFNKYSSLRYNLALGVVCFGLFLSVLCLLQMVLLVFRSYKPNHILSFTLEPLIVFFILFCWSFVGIHLALSAVTSDFCYSPQNSLVDSLMHAGLNDASLVPYAASGSVSPNGSMLASLKSLKEDFFSITDLIREGKQEMGACPNGTLHLELFEQAIVLSTDKSISLSIDLHYNSLHPLYSDFANGLCRNYFRGIIYWFIGMIISGVMAAILLSIKDASDAPDPSVARNYLLALHMNSADDDLELYNPGNHIFMSQSYP